MPFATVLVVVDANARLGPRASVNFSFLHVHEARLLESAAAAEALLFRDPVAALIRLRQFGEFLAKEAAAIVGVYMADNDSQHALIRRLEDRRCLHGGPHSYVVQVESGHDWPPRVPHRGTPPLTVDHCCLTISS